jgi:hypothetical protein
VKCKRLIKAQGADRMGRKGTESVESLVANPLGKRFLKKPRRSCEDINKIDLKGIWRRVGGRWNTYHV